MTFLLLRSFVFPDLSCLQALSAEIFQFSRLTTAVASLSRWARRRGDGICMGTSDSWTKCQSLLTHRYMVTHQMVVGNLQLQFHSSRRWFTCSWKPQAFKSLLWKLLKLLWQAWVVKQFIIFSLPGELVKQLKEKVVRSAHDCHRWSLSSLMPPNTSLLLSPVPLSLK